MIWTAVVLSVVGVWFIAGNLRVEIFVGSAALFLGGFLYGRSFERALP